MKTGITILMSLVIFLIAYFSVKKINRQWHIKITKKLLKDIREIFLVANVLLYAFCFSGVWHLISRLFRRSYFLMGQDFLISIWMMVFASCFLAVFLIIPRISLFKANNYKPILKNKLQKLFIFQGFLYLSFSLISIILTKLYVNYGSMLFDSYGMLDEPQLIVNSFLYLLISLFSIATFTLYLISVRILGEFHQPLLLKGRLKWLRPKTGK